MAKNNVKERRKALGWSRAHLGQKAYVDRRVIQLIEMEQSHDTEAMERIEAILSAAESAQADA